MSSTLATMRAILVPENGGAGILKYTESQPIPSLSDGQVLVKNSFAGINFIDIYFRKGLYPAPGGLPFIPGTEASGTIVRTCGNTLDLQEGDLVVWIGAQGYAEYTALSANRVIKIPQGLSAELAVGGFTMGMTALTLVKEAFQVKKGMTVLVHAAAGGVGLLLCQILKSLEAVVIGTAGGPQKCVLAKENGATHVFDYQDKNGPGWVEQVMKITGGEGVDCVYDSVGKDTYEGSLQVVKRKGTVVYFGNSSGPIPPLDLSRLASKSISIRRSTLLNYIVTRRELEDYANNILNLIKDEEIKVKIHEIYPLKDAGKAHEELEQRRTTGKLLLKMKDDEQEKV